MYVASASTTVKFHELPSGSVVHNYQPNGQVDGPVRSVSWSKDGNWLALVPFSGQVEIISVKEQVKLIHKIQGIEEPACASFQNTTKKNIAIGTKDGQVLVYDIKGRSVKKRFPRTKSMVSHINFTAKDNFIVSACSNGEAHIYNNVTNMHSGSFTIPKSSSINTLATNPIKRNYVAMGSNEGIVAVWDIHLNKVKFVNNSHKSPVTSVVFSPINSDLMASSGMDRQFCFYDIGGGKFLKSVPVEHNIMSVDFSPDGKYIVMASQKGKIYVYDSRNIDEPIHSFVAHTGSIKHISFRKAEDADASIYSITFDNLKEEEKEKEKEKEKESFRLQLTPSCEAGLLSVAFNETTGDSFMAAMGLNKTSDSSKLETMRVSDKKMGFASPSLLKVKEHEIQRTSTPNVFKPNLTVSPIIQIADNVDGPKSPTVQVPGLENTIRDMVKEVIKDELKDTVEELKRDFKYHSTHVTTQTRQLILDLLMQMVKESIKVENNFHQLREDLATTHSSESLVEENVALRQRLAELEEQLSQYKMNEANNKRM